MAAAAAPCKPLARLHRGASVARVFPSPIAASRALRVASRSLAPAVRSRPSIVCAAAAVETMAPVPRVVHSTLPRVYVYDHCPFCVRVRLALGYKNVKHEVFFMANDDKQTPMKLVGKKVAPIFELRDEGFAMMESMDIIKKIDSEERYGQTNVIAPQSERKDIKAWMKSTQDLLRTLHRPRYMMATLPEFAQKDSRDYFVAGHQLPPYEKAQWKEELDMATKWKLYREAFEKTPQLLPELNAKLRELEAMIHCEYYCTEGSGFSYDDIDLWARLRSLTLVKGAQFGPKTRAYIDNIAAMCDVTTYDCMAM